MAVWQELGKTACADRRVTRCAGSDFPETGGRGQSAGQNWAPGLRMLWGFQYGDPGGGTLPLELSVWVFPGSRNWLKELVGTGRGAAHHHPALPLWGTANPPPPLNFGKPRHLAKPLAGLVGTDDPTGA